MTDLAPRANDHPECARCWRCPDCRARWCVTVADSAHSCPHGDDLDTPRANELVTAYLAGRAPATRDAYAKDLRVLAAHLGVSGAREVAARLLGSTPGEANGLVLGWRSAQLDAGLAPRTINRRLAAVRSLVKLGRLLGMVTFTIDVDGLPTRAYRDLASISWDDYERALVGATVRERAILRLMGDRGLRRGEVLSLDLGHVGDACASVAVAGKGRGGERERLTLAGTTADALSAWIGERGERPGPLFGGRGPEGRMNGSTVYRLVSRIMGCRPHALRHLAVTRGLDVTNGDVRAVCRFARHSRPETTLAYDDARTDMGGKVARMVTESE